jgi:GH18 family chitinase
MKLSTLTKLAIPLLLASLVSTSVIQSNVAPNGNDTSHGTPQPTAIGRAVVAYYADWTTGVMAPENIPFKKITHINYGK